jgi:SAM-dependent methyltransferase
VTGSEDPDALRSGQLDRWQRSAPGWAARREWIRTFGMPVSRAMIDALAPRPGERVLELAAGVGDTGFLAAELIRPGGTLVSSDATEGMLEQARARALELGAENVEFARLELEWIDLPTASVDAVLCRWGFMFALDPGAALSETRRVLRPGGRIALAVWDEPEHNPWSTISTSALVNLGYAEAPDPSAPGMFTLAAPGRVMTLLLDAGFTEASVHGLDFEAIYETVDAYLEIQRDLSRHFGDVTAGLSSAELGALRAEIEQRAAPFTAEIGGPLRMPARSLVASASA